MGVWVQLQDQRAVRAAIHEVYKSSMLGGLKAAEPMDSGQDFKTQPKPFQPRPLCCQMYYMGLFCPELAIIGHVKKNITNTLQKPTLHV